MRRTRGGAGVLELLTAGSLGCGVTPSEDATETTTVGETSVGETTSGTTKGSEGEETSVGTVTSGETTEGVGCQTSEECPQESPICAEGECRGCMEGESGDAECGERDASKGCSAPVET